LVRFKIPLLPMFMSGMYIVLFLAKERKRLRNRGETYKAESYRDGDPGIKRDRSGYPI
jgi:hypothetical protein